MNSTLIEQVTEFNCLGLTVNEHMNWNSHTQNIANKDLRTLGVMKRLIGCLPISTMELIYDLLMYGSLIILHLLIANYKLGRRIASLIKVRFIPACTDK